MNEFNIAEIAEYNLRRFVGTDATRDVAEKWFPGWEFYEHLSRDTREKVLAKFPEPVEPVVNADFHEEPSAMVCGSSLKVVR